MISIPTPNYVITEAHVVSNGPYDTITLPAGSFVRPIEPRYVPKHVLENPKWKFFNKDIECFVYCKIGIVVMPKKILRQV